MRALHEQRESWVEDERAGSTDAAVEVKPLGAATAIRIRVASETAAMTQLRALRKDPIKKGAATAAPAAHG